MEEDKGDFRKSEFESIPSIVPLAITVGAIIGAIYTFAQEYPANELPIQYATSALFVSVAGISFSFYVFSS